MCASLPVTLTTPETNCSCAGSALLSASLEPVLGCCCHIQTGPVSGPVCQPVFPVHSLKAGFYPLHGSSLLGRVGS